MMKKPLVRLVVRALLVGAGVLVAQLQASDHLDASVLRAAAVAAGLAALEVFTPLNQAAGLFKKKPSVVVPIEMAPHVVTLTPKPSASTAVKRTPTPTQKKTASKSKTTTAKKRTASKKKPR